MADRSDNAHHVALASETRRQILGMLVESRDPLDALSIATRIDLHLTTVRFHLGHLEGSGMVRRQPVSEKRRGRPRTFYTATPVVRSESSQVQLIDVLAEALATHADGGRASAEDAGRQWADDLVAQNTVPGTNSADLLTVLDQLGFDPHTDAEGTIELRACPFRVSATAHPQVVCSVHRGLIERILEIEEDSSPNVALLPFVQPDLCVITGTRRPTLRDE